MVEALQAANRVLDKQHESAEQELRRKEAERERRRQARATRAAAKGRVDSGEATSQPPVEAGPPTECEEEAPASTDQGDDPLSAASFFGRPVKQSGAADQKPAAGGAGRSRRRRGSAILTAISTHAPEMKGIPWERLARDSSACASVTPAGEKEPEGRLATHAAPVNEVSTLKTASMHPYVAIYVQVFLRPDGDSIATRRSRRGAKVPPGSGNGSPVRATPVARPTPRLRNVVRGMALSVRASPPVAARAPLMPPARRRCSRCRARTRRRGTGASRGRPPCHGGRSRPRPRPASPSAGRGATVPGRPAEPQATTQRPAQRARQVSRKRGRAVRSPPSAWTPSSPGPRRAASCRSAFNRSCAAPVTPRKTNQQLPVRREMLAWAGGAVAIASAQRHSLATAVISCLRHAVHSDGAKMVPQFRPSVHHGARGGLASLQLFASRPGLQHQHHPLARFPPAAVLVYVPSCLFLAVWDRVVERCGAGAAVWIAADGGATADHADLTTWEQYGPSSAGDWAVRNDRIWLDQNMCALVLGGGGQGEDTN